MPKRVVGLTVLQVKTAGVGRHADGDGLYLLVRDTGAWWIMRYRHAGTDREIGLGRARGRGAVTLADARSAAAEHRRSLRGGIDPLVARQAAAAASATGKPATTFRAATEQFLSEREQGWRNPKHRSQWRTSLATYAMPLLGNKAVNAIDTSDVLLVLRPIWQKVPETASRLRGRIEAILDYSAVHSWREGSNPARWKGHLKEVLLARAKVRQVEHHSALPWREAAAFMQALAAREGSGARALAWTILTAARTGETIGARWDEIDLAEAVWTIPADRMKAGREHRVPLSPAALATLSAVRPPDDVPALYVFAGGKADQPLSNMAMTTALRRMGHGNITVHGFRSSFRDWCSEATNTPRDLAEACLAHTISSKVEAAYRRGDMLERRRLVMEAWATFLAQPSPGSVLPTP